MKLTFRKVGAFCLAVIMLIGLFPGFDGFALESDTESAEYITNGETKTVSVEAGATVYLKFIPAVSGTYIFSADSGVDTYGTLCDENKNEILYNDDGETSDFSLECALEAGQTYYFGAKFYDSNLSGEFKVTLVCKDPVCEHTSTRTVGEQAATCTEPGYTEGVFCDICKTWVSGHEKVAAKGHIDENSDGVCDICGREVPSIRSGETKTLKISRDETVYLRFVPSASGVYTFAANYVFGTVGYICDKDKNVLNTNEEFSLTYTFRLGEVYYLGASYSGESPTVDLEISLTCDKVLCDHVNTVTEAAVEATCSVPGYTEGVLCRDCGEWVSGHELIRVPHTDSDSDGKCDVCGGEVVSVTSDGPCADNLWWTLYSDGTLEISGNGEMKFIDEIPWGNNIYNIRKVIIRDGVKNIAETAFSNCYNLTQVILSSTVKSVGSNAFNSCPKLEEVIIPEGVNEIGSMAFAMCSSLKAVNLPSTVMSIGENVFFLCSGLTEINVADKNANYASVGGVLFNKDMDTVIRYPSSKPEKEYEIPNGVKHIAKFSFNILENMTKVVIPESVETIEESAFEVSDSLETVEIKNGLKTIERSAFNSCGNLKKINIPASVEYINLEYTFNSCSNLKEIAVDDGNLFYASIDGVLYNKEKTTLLQFPHNYGESYAVPDGTVTIAEDSFAERNKIKSVTFPTSLRTIERTAFANCWNLKEIVLPNGLEYLGENAFVNCIGLQSVTLPESMKYIESSAFAQCEKLEKVYWNCEECEISGWPRNNIFGSVTGRMSGFGIVFGDSVRTVPACFMNSVNLKSAAFGKSIKSIADGAFSNCKNLTDISLPNGLLSVGGQAFADCGLMSVRIPETVTEIGNNAFGYTSDYSGTYTRIDGFRIYGVPETSAETYASENGFEFVDITAHVHAYSSEVTKEPTCTEKGIMTFTCECGDVYTEEIETLKHFFSEEWTVDKQPTCTEKGSKSHRCLKCGEKSDITEIAPEGHTEAADQAVAPTCEKSGLTAGKHCSVCNETIIAQTVVPALGHKPVAIKAVAATCTKSGKTAGEKCSVCGKVIKPQTEIKAKGHKFASSTAKATVGKDGSVITKCTVCGAVKSKTAIASIKTVALSKTSFTYNGKAQRPSVIVKDRNGKILRNGVDYTVKYSSGCKNVGSYTVTVTFKGSYYGARTLTFTIIPKGTSVSKLTAGKKQFTAKWSKQTTQTSGYELQYSTKSNMSGAKTVNVGKNKTTSATVKKLKKGKKYYVRIRTYKTVKINGKSVKLYSAWSKVRNVKAK